MTAERTAAIPAKLAALFVVALYSLWSFAPITVTRPSKRKWPRPETVGAMVGLFLGGRLASLWLRRSDLAAGGVTAPPWGLQ